MKAKFNSELKIWRIIFDNEKDEDRYRACSNCKKLFAEEEGRYLCSKYKVAFCKECSEEGDSKTLLCEKSSAIAVGQISTWMNEHTHYPYKI